jgi:hypothetical protein
VRALKLNLPLNRNMLFLRSISLALVLRLIKRTLSRKQLLRRIKATMQNWQLRFATGLYQMPSLRKSFGAKSLIQTQKTVLKISPWKYKAFSNASNNLTCLHLISKLTMRSCQRLLRQEIVNLQSCLWKVSPQPSWLVKVTRFNFNKS